MKKLLSVLIIAGTFGSTALAVDIAISTKSGWWSQTAADQEMQDIVNNVKGASVEVFTVNELAALADWVRAHTGNGVPDLLIMCGNFPDTIYPAGNAQPNGSLAEQFLDDGNTIINTGDYIFYVGTSGNNDAGGLQNMMDVPGAAMWGMILSPLPSFPPLTASCILRLCQHRPRIAPGFLPNSTVRIGTSNWLSLRIVLAPRSIPAFCAIPLRAAASASSSRWPISSRISVAK